ncbi:MAG: hypothetical protein MHM6MM_003048 [Cercozoa sp. M6MM]
MQTREKRLRSVGCGISATLKVCISDSRGLCRQTAQVRLRLGDRVEHMRIGGERRELDFGALDDDETHLEIAVFDRDVMGVVTCQGGVVIATASLKTARCSEWFKLHRLKESDSAPHETAQLYLHFWCDGGHQARRQRLRAALSQCTQHCPDSSLRFEHRDKWVTLPNVVHRSETAEVCLQDCAFAVNGNLCQGTVFITSLRLLLLATGKTAVSQAVPLSCILAVTTTQIDTRVLRQTAYVIDMKCSDMRRVHLYLPQSETSTALFASLKRRLRFSVANRHRLLAAFMCNAAGAAGPSPPRSSEVDEDSQVSKRPLLWTRPSLKNEFQRQGAIAGGRDNNILDTNCLYWDEDEEDNDNNDQEDEDDDAPFRWTDINRNYELCPSYPEGLAVPAGISDDEVRQSAEFRSSRRLPVLTYYCAKSQAAILRSSQPKTGLSYSRCAADERILSYVYVTVLATRQCKK